MIKGGSDGSEGKREAQRVLTNRAMLQKSPTEKQSLYLSLIKVRAELSVCMIRPAALDCKLQLLVLVSPCFERFASRTCNTVRY